MSTAKASHTTNLSLADLRKGGSHTEFPVPELSGSLWLRQLPAARVMEYIEQSGEVEDQSKSAKNRVMRDSMVEFIKQAVVTSETDATLLFGELSIAEIKDVLSIGVFNRLLEAITSMAGLGATKGENEAAVAEGKDFEAAPIVSSPTA